MGDFNEVRTIEERHGSLFNILAADIFNSFIYRNGLKEIPLGGCKFTWCHKSATKMSKLDRFLIYEGLIDSCPNLAAITLERFLSDHRPILMRESHFDYGPVPFRFFNYWFELEGFDNFIERTWNEADVYNSNTMSKLMIKLKFPKEKIHTLIDIGEGNKDLINKRTELSNLLQELNKMESLELAQKTKIKWAIEGDENSKYFHGVLNKHRNQMAIRGILSKGVWIESPNLVKDEFFSHFANRFDKPTDFRL
ncbi:RNA-directed DNA polymerase, eukaryota, partial [Tanacetum coccineum]